MGNERYVRVRAITDVYDNGNRRRIGEVFEMEESLVGPHVAAGQVEAVEAMAAAPADKQVTGSATK